MWRTKLSNANLDISIYWPNNFPKLTDSMSKDIHYLFSYNALVTRNRISKWDRNTPEFCKFCLSKRNKVKETNLHAMISCPRISNFWLKFKNFALKFNCILTNEGKIFGFANQENDIEKNLLNSAIQIAQETVWVTRKNFENCDLVIDPWKIFISSIDKRLEMWKNYGSGYENIVKFQRFLDN